MPTERSVKAVETLTAAFSESPLVVAAEYRGLDVARMNGLRTALRQADCRFRIAKNTLARIAADNAGRPHLKEIIDGPIGFVTSPGDPANAAKVLVEYVQANRLEMNVVGGLLDEQVLSPERVDALAKLPTRDELLAKLLGNMNGPVQGLVTVLNGPVRALAIVLQRHIENQQGAEQAA